MFNNENNKNTNLFERNQPVAPIDTFCSKHGMFRSIN